jgi:hypothetical protein
MDQWRAMLVLKMMGWAGHVARMGEGAFMNFGWEISGKETLGKPTHSWRYNIKTVFKKCVLRVGWIYVVQDKDKCWALETMVMNLLVP